jgi:hypothetical protein
MQFQLTAITGRCHDNDTLIALSTWLQKHHHSPVDREWRQDTIAAAVERMIQCRMTANFSGATPSNRYYRRCDK